MPRYTFLFLVCIVVLAGCSTSKSTTNSPCDRADELQIRFDSLMEQQAAAITSVGGSSGSLSADDIARKYDGLDHKIHTTQSDLEQAQLECNKLRIEAQSD
jgi:hypothetical protein